MGYRYKPTAFYVSSSRGQQNASFRLEELKCRCKRKADITECELMLSASIHPVWLMNGKFLLHFLLHVSEVFHFNLFSACFSKICANDSELFWQDKKFAQEQHVLTKLMQTLNPIPSFLFFHLKSTSFLVSSLSTSKLFSL